VQIDAAAAAVVDRLKAAGLVATLDPRDLNPPGVWVQIETVRRDRFDADTWSGEWVLLAIAPDVGTAGALRILGELVAKIYTAFPTAADALAQSVTLPSGGDPLPAFRVPLALKASDDPEPP
jgi:hypothetical protein